MNNFSFFGVCVLFYVILFLLIFTKTMLLLSFYLINFFFHENYFSFFMFRDVPACSGMFRYVPECSMFLVLSTPLKFSLRVPPRKEHMCAKYSLPPFDWLKLSHFLVSGESTLHEVTLFEARSRIFLPTAQSCPALFCCRLAILASSFGWLVGKN